MAERRLDRWLRPRYVLPLLALIVVVAVIVSPEEEPGAGAAGLTTYSPRPAGAQGIYQVLQRLGWSVSRRLQPLRAPVDTGVTYLVLDPPLDPSATEVGVLLDAVRGGASAIVVPSPGTPLADSLRIAHVPLPMGYFTVAEAADTVSSDSATDAVRQAALDVHTFSRFLVPQRTEEEDTTPRFPRDMEVLVRVQGDTKLQPAIAARRIGAGRVLVLADPSFLRNTDARDTAGAVLAVRLLEWLAPGRRRPLVFDEYHQGYGVHANLPGTVAHALGATEPGRMVLQLLVAGLVLLVAVAVRPIPPRPRQRIERRSPFEHVGALARAYEQIGATRLATRRLVRGLRRRHPMGAGTSLDDERYLGVLSTRMPALADDARVLTRALAKPLPVADWVAISGAIDHIERTFIQ